MCRRALLHATIPAWPRDGTEGGCSRLQSEELQAKLDANAPELFEGEPDLPPVPDAIDGLLESALPGTAGYRQDADAQSDFIRDILPEGDDDPPGSEAADEE